MHTAIFDIGKTNKKFCIFDENLNEVYRVFERLHETEDEDGFSCEDLPQLTKWMKDHLKKAVRSKEFQITRLNFSTYGASFVHLDKKGVPVTPLYNYLKPFPEHLQHSFAEMVGDAEDFSVRTASPALGMLNSGLQLYWLQKERSSLFSRIKTSLHFPQYCSYLFSGQLASEYTSIGCHTALWDYTQQKYHPWVEKCGMTPLFPEIVPATTITRALVKGQEMEVGTGLHDSSAALLPYLASSREPFLLLSTGTWSITFNPFSQDHLTPEELKADCLNFMRVDGSPVKASRLFFGKEFNIQTKRMAGYFGKSDPNYHHNVAYDEHLYQKWSVEKEPIFHLHSMQYPDQSIPSADYTNWERFTTYEEAYHRLLIEMMGHQARAIQLAAGSTPIRKLYLDGGFLQNEVFLNLLRKAFPAFEIIVSKAPLGSSLGAAMAVSKAETIEKFGFDFEIKKVTA
jgi:L-fuculokinase